MWVMYAILLIIFTVIDIVIFVGMEKKVNLLSDIVINHTKILDIVVKEQINQKHGIINSRCWRMNKEEVKDESNDKHADGSEDQS